MLSFIRIALVLCLTAIEQRLRQPPIKWNIKQADKTENRKASFTKISTTVEDQQNQYASREVNWKKYKVLVLGIREKIS